MAEFYGDRQIARLGLVEISVEGVGNIRVRKEVHRQALGLYESDDDY
jgi:hypothetical protein